MDNGSSRGEEDTISLFSDHGAFGKRLKTPMRLCLDGDAGGLGVGNGTSSVLLWNTERFGCCSYTFERILTVETGDDCSSSSMAGVPGLAGFRALLIFDHILFVSRK